MMHRWVSIDAQMGQHWCTGGSALMHRWVSIEVEVWWS